MKLAKNKLLVLLANDNSDKQLESTDGNTGLDEVIRRVSEYVLQLKRSVN
jgi:hypothetical protein